MSTDHLISPRIAEALRTIHVEPGGLRAVAGTETFEDDNPRLVSKKLATALYQTLHAGREESLSTRPRSYRDRELDALLTAATPHRHTVSRGRLLAREDDGGRAVVQLDGLRVLVPADTVAATGSELPAPATVTVPAVRPGLSPGFFLADGSHGKDMGGAETLRLYVHLRDQDAAPAVWEAVLTFLEEARLPYRAKISSSAHLYPRRDALVVYLGPRAWHRAHDIADRVAGLDGIGEDTSAFTQRIAPGVGLAWEPDDRRPGRRGLSFGEHRTAILAEGLLQHATGDPADAGDPAEAVAGAFLDASIDPLNPARNLGSPMVDALVPA